MAEREAPSTPDPMWTLVRADSPVLTTAIHDGHAVRAALAGRFALGEAERLREEDPFTGQAAAAHPNHLIAHRSRFEVDLNRGEDEAVYATPEASWGLEVWASPLSRDEIQASLDYHRAFYRQARLTLEDMARRHERFVVLDLHSYNHRRDGPDGPPMDPETAPDINIGTFSMPRERWRDVLDAVTEVVADFDFAGRRLDVRENVAFQGRGALTRLVHETWPDQGCAVAFEFKKIFMDEWTGRPDPRALEAMRGLVRRLAERLEGLL